MQNINEIDTWVFDLDNTLYDAETGLMNRISSRMSQFIAELRGISMAEADLVRKDYWDRYGMTLHGLMADHQVDPHEFLSYAHDLDVSDVPACDIISEYLHYLPGRKVIFTNAPRHFAERMSSHLGIDKHFSGIFSIEDANFTAKPQEKAYNAFINRFDVTPARACMLDDMHVNLKTASDLGMKTVWIHGDESGDHAYITSKAVNLADWLRNNMQKG